MSDAVTVAIIKGVVAILVAVIGRRRVVVYKMREAAGASNPQEGPGFFLPMVAAFLFLVMPFILAAVLPQVSFPRQEGDPLDESTSNILFGYGMVNAFFILVTTPLSQKDKAGNSSKESKTDGEGCLYVLLAMFGAIGWAYFGVSIAQRWIS